MYLKRKGIRLEWTKIERIKVGNWAFHACLQAIPNIIENVNGGPCLTEYARSLPWDIIKKEHELTETPSAPWVWLCNLEREPFLRRSFAHKRVRRDDKAAVHLVKSTRDHMAAVNFLKSTGWTINERVYEFLKQLGEWREPPLLEFGPRDYFWTNKYGRRHYPNRGLWSVFDADMRVAERFRGKTFYTDLACDFRGRIVPMTHFNYLREDYVRGLFLFAEGKPIGKRGLYWLMVSTCKRFQREQGNDP